VSVSTSTATRAISSERLVLEVNRIFHDLEGAGYEDKHDEIFVAELERWRQVAATWLADATGPRRLLDIGTGTGFVPRTIGPFLRCDDEYVLSDLSISMLACARERLSAIDLPCRLRFEPVDGVTYPFPSKSFDVVTGNSVVHHVPDLRRLFSELDRILKPGGLLLIGHEPNLDHFRVKGLRRRSKLIAPLCDPLGLVIGAAKAIGLGQLAGAFGLRSKIRGAALRARGIQVAQQVRQTEEILDRVGVQLVDQGIVDTAPSREQLVQWIDFHSPTAGAEVDPTRGLEFEKVRRIWLPDYERVHFETYDHISGGGRVAKRGSLLRLGDRWLARRYPNAGATLFFVLRKPT
jgi:SAM-dependent methyltransferase